VQVDKVVTYDVGIPASSDSHDYGAGAACCREAGRRVLHDQRSGWRDTAGAGSMEVTVGCRLGMPDGLAGGRGRRCSMRDVAALRMVQHLSQEEGINLNGIRRILQMERRIEQLSEQVDELTDTVRGMQVARYQGSEDPRVFTAESTGRVHMGRTVVHAQLALPSHRG